MGSHDLVRMGWSDFPLSKLDKARVSGALSFPGLLLGGGPQPLLVCAGQEPLVHSVVGAVEDPDRVGPVPGQETVNPSSIVPGCQFFRLHYCLGLSLFADTSIRQATGWLL